MKILQLNSTTGAPRFGASVRRRVLKDGGVAESFKDIVILEGARTPFAKMNGSFKNLTPFDLFYFAGKAALERAGVKPKEVNQAIVGQMIPNEVNAAFLPKSVERDLDIPSGSLALGINRLCGTGFEAIRQAALNLTNGGDSVILTGGVENMSRTPVIDNEVMSLARDAQAEMKANPERGKALLDAVTKRGPKTLFPVTDSLTDPIDHWVMYQTADQAARATGVSRQDGDQLAVASHKKAATAQLLDRFQPEIVPVTQEGLAQLRQTRQSRGSHLATGELPPGIQAVLQDEHVRLDTSLESLAGLKPLDKASDAVTTAANASGVVDGAAALPVTTGKLAKRNHYNMLAHLKAASVVGIDSKMLGLAPVRAMTEALRSAKLTLNDIDILEVNEAFAPQAFAVTKQLAQDHGYPLDKLLAKLNPDGGSVAIGHPLAATGTRITLHAGHRLKQSNKRYALVSACIGGGQGIALVIENPQYKPDKKA